MESSDDGLKRLLAWIDAAAKHGAYARDVPVIAFLTRVAKAWDQFAHDTSGALKPPSTDPSKCGMDRLISGKDWWAKQLLYTTLDTLAKLIDPAWSHLHQRPPTEMDFVNGLAKDLRTMLLLRQIVAILASKQDGISDKDALGGGAADCT